MTGTGDDILLEVRNLSKSFTLPRPLLQRLRGAPAVSVRALDDVSLTVRRGKTLGIVGKSGCGKSTLARCLVRLVAADSGSIIYDGIDVGGSAAPNCAAITAASSSSSRIPTVRSIRVSRSAGC